MKNISLVSLFVLAVASAAYAQDSTRTNSSTQTYSSTTTTNTYSSTDRKFVPFKVGIGVGWAVPGQTNGGGGGVLLYVEPTYRASDMVSLGLKLESAIIARSVSAINNNNDVKGDATANLSYTLNAQFYFTDDNIRPFIGAGAGAYSLAATTFNTASNGNDINNNVSGETLFGFYPRIGLDAGHFNLTIDYNFIPKSSVVGGGQITNNYLGIRAGMSIGGGKYKK